MYDDEISFSDTINIFTDPTILNKESTQEIETKKVKE